MTIRTQSNDLIHRMKYGILRDHKVSIARFYSIIMYPSKRSVSYVDHFKVLLETSDRKNKYRFYTTGTYRNISYLDEIVRQLDDSYQR